MARTRDWFITIIIAAGIFVLLGGLVLLFQNLLAPTAPLTGQGGLLQALALLFIAVMLFMIARRRALLNETIRVNAGCPSCQEDKLKRVHRKPWDRLIARSGVPVARYKCTNCGWEGRRVRIKGTPKDDQHPYALPMSDISLAVISDGDSDSAPVERVRTPKLAPGPAVDGPTDSGQIAGPAVAKLRKEPRLDGEVIARLEPGTKVTILNRTKAGNSHTWFQVSVDDDQGWVLGMSIKRSQQSAISSWPSAAS